MNENEQSRGIWNSKIGFILAAAGSAIGLGNIWRFPYVTGQNGGAVFVLIYLFFIIMIGMPIMIAELTIGRKTKKNPVGAFKTLYPGSRWKIVGGIGVVTMTVGFSFYAVIAGLSVGYFLKTVTGGFNQITTGAQSAEIYSAFSSNPLVTIGLLFLFIFITVLVVRGGISSGIERWSKILMPVLFIILIVLAIRSVTLEGAGKGLSFYLKPDFSKITGTTLVQALGQALFSLSLGAGTMITYGSYISKRDNLITSAASVCLFDTAIAILAGLIIFPALFSMGMDPAAGPGLVFVVLPSIFTKLPGGMIFGAGLFLLLSLAALTTTISLLEVPVAYYVDEKNWSRKKASLWIGTVAFILGLPSALSLGASEWFSNLPLFKKGFLDLMVIIFANYSLTIGAFFYAIFIGYKWGIQSAVAEIEQEGNRFTLKSVWAFLIRFICPVAIAVIFGYIIITGHYLN